MEAQAVSCVPAIPKLAYSHGAGIGGILGGTAAFGVPSSAYALSRAMTSPVALNWAGQPAFGSGSQSASMAAAPGNLAEQRRLCVALDLRPFLQ
jgi:hypothetical protein